MASATRNLVIILDFGAQYTQLIARRVREAGVYCEIHRFDVPPARLAELAPKAIILSGGPRSVYDAGAPIIGTPVFELGVPVLGICYGVQLIAHVLGGTVERAEQREYGPATVHVDRAEGVLGRFDAGESLEVWMSHGDRVTALPPGFVTLGTNPSTPACVIGDPKRRIYGLQFHPEVTHTPDGREMIAAFLFDVAGIEANWSPASFAEEAIAQVRASVPEDDRVVLGLSGGVDSSVAAVLCQRALGERLTCIFVDNGLLRHHEAEEVVRMFRDHFELYVIAIDAADEFLSALAGVTDPERKRKIIGATFIDVFEREARKIGRVRWLAQGTLYPDVIESVPVHGSSSVIKSHHNVGGLPERMKLKLIEPLRELFKDEVRAAGVALGLPKTVLGRHPFPGPGLAVRCLGEVTRERLEVLRAADKIFIDELRAADLYDSVWQAFCVLLPVRSVGVMGDERTYDEVVAVRAIHSNDGMTADWARLPHDLLGKVASRIINEVRGVNRVVYDLSSKPPATIEWE